MPTEPTSEPSASELELLDCLAYDHANDPSNIAESVTAIRACAAREVARGRGKVAETLSVFDAPGSIYVRELVDGEWTHSLAELPGDKAVAHTIRLLRRTLCADAESGGG